MLLEKTIEGVIAIFIIMVFIVSVIPALTQATGVSIPFLILSLILLIVGISFAIIKAWMD